MPSCSSQASLARGAHSSGRCCAIDGRGPLPELRYDTPDLEPQLKSIISTCGGPEDINEGPQTAPSKRILRLCPQYNKPNDGVMIATEIGLKKMRAACPHFDAWVTRLERISSRREGDR